MERQSSTVNDRIHISRETLAAYCARWKIKEFALFGSVLRDTFNPKSDIDVMVAFDSSAQWTLFDHVEMRDELKALLGRNVDLITKPAVEQSRNPIRRKAILDSAQVIYAA